MDFLRKILHPEPVGPALVFDCRNHTLNGVRVNQDVQPLLDCLGPPTPERRSTSVEFPPEVLEALATIQEYERSGVWLQFEKDRKLQSFTLWWQPILGKAFGGSVTRDGVPVSLSAHTTQQDILRMFGTPYWTGTNDAMLAGELAIFYEFMEDNIEWEFVLKEGRLRSLEVQWDPSLAEEEVREMFGVTVPWPPR